jgi:hypothetical protein
LHRIDIIKTCEFVRSKSLSASRIRASRDCGYAADNLLDGASAATIALERGSPWLRSSFSGKSIIRKRQSIFLAALPKSQARPIQFFVRP